MKRSARLMGLLVVGGIFLGGCQTPQFQTLKILDSPNRVVALQAMRDAYGGKGYDHPVSFTNEEMTQILQGIRAEKTGLYSSSSSRSSSIPASAELSGASRSAFSGTREQEQPPSHDTDFVVWTRACRGGFSERWHARESESGEYPLPRMKSVGGSGHGDGGIPSRCRLAGFASI